MAKPERVRYLHSRPWFGCIYNEVNLPIGPFEVEARAVALSNSVETTSPGVAASRVQR